MFLPALPDAAKAQPLRVRFNQITIDPSIIYGGISANFPDPVLSVLTIKDSHNRYVHGLADTSRWLGADDFTQNGQLVSDTWKTILETHADNPLRPRNPDVKTTQPGFQVREMKLNMGLSVALVMDFSGSMIGRLDSVDNAGKEFIRQMGSKDRAAIFKFSGDCIMLQDFTSDTTKLIAAVENDTSTYTGTYLYDALWTALEATEKEPERRIIICYTDGRDHQMGHSINQVVEKAMQDSIPLYMIGLSNNNSNSGGPAMSALQYLADYTGGLFYFAPSLDSLAGIYKAIYGHISGYYVLAHASPDPFTNGRKRVLDLSMDYLEELGSTKLHHEGRDTIHYSVPFIPPNVTPRLTASTDSVSPGRRYVMAGDTAVYGITVRNTGRGNAAETQVVFAPGDSMNAIRYSPVPDSARGDSIYWFFPRINSGDSSRIRLTARLRSKMPRGDTAIRSRVRVTCLDDSLPGDNNASATVYGMGRPDLIPRVTPIADTLSPGKPFQFRATVKNSGNADLSAPFKVGLFVENAATPILEKTVASLALHDSAGLDFELSLPITGRYRMRVTADADGQIPELSENNNSSETSVIVGGPDLIPRVTPIADTLSPGKPFRFHATVRNTGNADCLFPFQVGLFVDEAASPILEKTVAFLALHDSAGLDFDLSLPLTGRYRMRATVDAAGQISELNEDDNSSETFVIVGGPDFTVRVQPAAGAVSPGYPVILQGVVRNLGNADCISPFQIGLFHESADSAAASTTIPSLARNDSARVAFTLTFPLRGHYWMRIKADARDQIPESNEINNTDSTAVTVGADALHVRLGGFSIDDAARGVSAGFPDRVFVEACVTDQNAHPVRGLADATRWQGVGESTPAGETVGGVWASLSEVHEENRSYPALSDVQSTVQVTEIDGSAITAAFVLDYSSAMAASGARAQSDLRGMIRRFSKDDRAAVIGFADDVGPLQSMTSDTSSLGASLARSYSGQNRRLYDALYSAIESLRGTAGRSPILAVTSGGDAGSGRTGEDVIRAAQESGVPVHLIAFSAGGSSPDLEALADATGGWARTVTADSQFTQATAFMEETLRNYYLLAFASSDTTEDRTRREVRLGLRSFNVSGADTGVYRAPLGRANLAVRTHVKGGSFTVSGGDTTWFIRTGETARYSTSLLNIGHQNLSNIRLSDVLPRSFIAESIPFNHRIAGDSLVWTLDSLPIRGVAQFSYSYRADTLFSLVDVPFTNTPTAECAQDSLIYDNRASDTVVYVPLKPPDFIVSVAGQGDSLIVANGDSTWFTFAGSTVRYSVTLTNIGELACSGISVTNVFAPELTLTDYSGPAYTQRGDTLFWSIDVLPSRGGTRIATYSCKVDTFLPPWEAPLINKAWAHSDQEQITGNNTGIDTVYIAPLIPPDPQVAVEPAVAEPGDSVRVRIMTPVTLKSYDIIVFYETGERVADFADPFIQRNPDPARGQWIEVDPAYADTRMRTNNTQERVGVVIVTTDLWNVTRSDTAYFTIKSADDYLLDRNVFRPAAGERMTFRFKLSSNRRTEILVYDISGAFVKLAADAWFAAGWNETGWDGKNEQGNTVGSGVYLAMIRSGDFRKAMKFILVR